MTSLCTSVHTQHVLNCIGLSKMPQKAETNPPPSSISQQDICCSGSAQVFPGGWNRWSGLVTLSSHCSRNLHHQAKLIIALDFAHQGKKDKLLSILCLLIVLVTPQEEHFTLADAVWGTVQWDSSAWAGKCPRCPRVAQIWLLLS